MKVQVLLFAVFLLISCNGRKEKFCGELLSENEINEMRNTYNKPFKYSNSDMDLMNEIDDEVSNLFKDTVNVDFVPFVHDSDRIGFYVSVPPDSLVIQNLCCNIFSNKWDTKMPKERVILLFERYSNDCICGVRVSN